MPKNKINTKLMDKLFIPDPTKQEIIEGFDKISNCIEAFEAKFPNKSWRKLYFETYPQMDNAKGVNKLNNFWLQKRFNADIYRSLITFFEFKNTEPCK